MSLQVGNEYLKKRLYQKAIEEYKKIDKNSPLYRQAEFNIKIIENRKNTDINLSQKQVNINIPNDILQREHETSNIKVSVIIPVYNVEPYLRQCLDSVINQTLKEIEIICVDDGSTDKSFDILNEYTVKDSRFIIIKQKNSGAAIARNRGLAIAKGEYLSFLDSDDFFELTMLEEMYQNAVSVDADITLCSGLIYNDITKERKLAPWFLQEKLIKSLQVFSIHTLKENIFKITKPNPWTKIYKRSFVLKNNIKFQNLKTCNDVYFSYISIILADKITYINKSFVNWRQNTKISTTSKRGMSYENIFFALNQIKADLERNSIFDEIKDQLYEKFNGHFFYEYQFIVKQDRQDFLSKAKALLPEKYYDIFLKECNDHDSINNPKVSVIIPVYNVEKYLRQCLDSVVNQTLKKIEIICINDGSTDNSLNILREYEKKDKRVIIIDQKNSGQGMARNAGLKIVKGKYITFVDSDDWIELNALEELYIKATNTNADMVLFSAEIFNERTKEIQKANHMFREDLFNNRDVFCYKDISNNLFQAIQANILKFYKSSLILDNNIFFPNMKFEDVYVSGISMLLAKRLTYINKPFYTYRTNVNFSTTYNRGIHRNDTFSVRNKLREYMIKNNFFNDSSLEASFYRKCTDTFSWIYPEVTKHDKADFVLKCKEFLPQKYFNEFVVKNKIEYFDNEMGEQRNQKLDKKAILDNIKSILQNNVLSNMKLNYNLWIYDNKTVIVQMLDMKISYDITLRQDNIIAEVTLKKDYDKDFIYKLYPMFPKDKNHMMIYATSSAAIDMLVDFIKREISRVINKCLLAKQVQSA